MKYLAFDTSSTYLTVIAKNQEKVYKTFIKECAMSHSVLLLDEIEKALNNVDLKVKDIDFCAVVTGPGSFTGIRIGVATAKGLVAPFQKKILSVTSFDCIAYADSSAKTLAVIDANHDNFYVCGYDNLNVSIEPKFMDKSQLEKISDYSMASFTVINGFDTVLVDVSLGLENYISKNYQNLISESQLSPFYLRLSQAEEGRK